MRCNKCRTDKELDKFPHNKRMKTGFSPYCKECWKIINQQSRKTYGNRYYAKYYSIKGKEHLRKRKEQALKVYGERCVLCGHNNFKDLCLDHIANGGYIHRILDFKAASLVIWVYKNNYPPGFQTLCRNCNARKYSEFRAANTGVYRYWDYLIERGELTTESIFNPPLPPNNL